MNLVRNWPGLLGEIEGQLQVGTPSHPLSGLWAGTDFRVGGRTTCNRLVVLVLYSVIPSPGFGNVSATEECQNKLPRTVDTRFWRYPCGRYMYLTWTTCGTEGVPPALVSQGVPLCAPTSVTYRAPVQKDSFGSWVPDMRLQTLLLFM
jgi:hypothetical protein